MKNPEPLLKSRASIVMLATLATTAIIIFPEIAQAQYHASQSAGYSYQETHQQGGQPILFGVAAYKICQIKSFLFAGVYILGAIAFVIFAIRALFTKFELKHFLPIFGALFVVAFSDLFIYWMSEDAFFCPTTLSQFSGN